MFDFDAALTDVIFRYCRERLAMDPVPLDFGGLRPLPGGALEGWLSPEGRDPQDVLDLFTETLAPSVVSSDSPAFLAFIPNAPTKNSLLFDMVVACSGLNGTSWLEASGVVAAENQALEFLARSAGLPAGAGGVFVSGGSMGNLSGLTVARDHGRDQRPEVNPRDVRFAISAEAHSSVGKSLHVLDVGALLVETDDHRFTRDALAAALRNDPHPENVIGVIATAGTTNAGIVDDLEGLGSFAREHNLWFHVDGAYGGAAMLSATHGHLFEGLRHADSFIVDPHKWLFAPLDCCALLYRDPTAARKVLAQQASYLDAIHDTNDEHYQWNPSDFALHLSRRPRGMPFWFSLLTNGTDAYRQAVQRAIDLAQRTQDLISSRDYLEMVRPSSLSIVLFRRRGWTPAEYNEWSHELVQRQIALVTPTKWLGETVARFAFLHPNTSVELVEEILDTMA